MQKVKAHRKKREAEELAGVELTDFLGNKLRCMLSPLLRLMRLKNGKVELYGSRNVAAIFADDVVFLRIGDSMLKEKWLSSCFIANLDHNP